MNAVPEEQIQAYVEYFRDLGVYDFYRRGDLYRRGDFYQQGEPECLPTIGVQVVSELVAEPESASAVAASVPASALRKVEAPPFSPAISPGLEPPIAKLISFDDLAPMPEARVEALGRPAALHAIRADIGDCTRCPLAYAGRHTIVFGDGNPNARLMFVGEGPGADEDASGVPFVGKAGQLLNNMIRAMGIERGDVYIANIVKCRPPGNRVPEPVEANTCSQFLLEQIDVIAPEVVVALGATAAMYLLGVRQSLGTLRGRWHRCRGAKLLVTYHPAFLLRDPRQKGEAWKDLRMVMEDLKLQVPKSGPK